MDLVYPNERTLFRIGLTLSVIFWAVLIIGSIGIVLIYIGLFAIFAILAQSSFITHIKGNGIKVTEAQYPDLHRQLLDCCNEVGVSDVPEMYLLRTDFFNALATRFLRRHYVVLFTDVVDALAVRPEAVKFYIGHELGHIHRNHIRWGWVLAPVSWLPVFGSALRRAEEYTCDRYGNACCASEEDAVAAMATIVAGDTRWESINVEAYLQQVQTTGGFFMSFNELTGEYPWLCKRMAWVLALRAGQEPNLPRRSKRAGLLSMFVPSIPGGAVSFLIIVAMVGILAAVALPAYQSYMETANAAAAARDEVVTANQPPPLATPANLTVVIEETADIRIRVEQHFKDNGVMPSDLTEMGGTESFVTTSVGLPVALYEGGVLAAPVDNDEAAFLVIEPVIEEGQVTWFCFGQGLADEILPEACRSE
ncbi:MAG: M48 family metalloprotease [Pseudomonadota bacterium]